MTSPRMGGGEREIDLSIFASRLFLVPIWWLRVQGAMQALGGRQEGKDAGGAGEQ